MDGSPSSKQPPLESANRVRSANRNGESTRSLLDRAQTGDDESLNEIFARYLPRLMRWASGRLPMDTREFIDTGDLVQDSLIKVVRALGGIHDRNPGTFPAYLRRAVLNRLYDETRKTSSRPGMTGLDGTELDPSPSPLEESIGRDLANHYESALMRLSEDDRAVLFLKIEMGMNYREIADAVDKNSNDAARMAVNRAVTRLAREMRDARQT